MQAAKKGVEERSGTGAPDEKRGRHNVCIEGSGGGIGGGGSGGGSGAQAVAVNAAVAVAITVAEMAVVAELMAVEKMAVMVAIYRGREGGGGGGSGGKGGRGGGGGGGGDGRQQWRWSGSATNRDTPFLPIQLFSLARKRGKKPDCLRKEEREEIEEERAGRR